MISRKACQLKPKTSNPSAYLWLLCMEMKFLIDNLEPFDLSLKIHTENARWNRKPRTLRLICFVFVRECNLSSKSSNPSVHLAFFFWKMQAEVRILEPFGLSYKVFWMNSRGSNFQLQKTSWAARAAKWSRIAWKWQFSPRKFSVDFFPEDGGLAARGLKLNLRLNFAI